MSDPQSPTRIESAAAEGRDRPALARRVLLIGLDGATFDVLNPMMEAGRMPRLRAFVESGSAGVLHSTVPPITPAAWTTCMTGKTPGAHGIIDFERYDVRTNALGFNSTRCLDHVRSIWRILSDRGLKVGSVNVPMTYPPTPVNGFMISGFETPSIDSDFTYPPDLKADLLRQFPDYSYKTKWRRRTLGGQALFAENLRYIVRSFHQGAELTRYCGDEYGWDVLMVVLKLVDNLQHKTWKYLDPRTREQHPARSAMVAGCFDELDKAVGNLLDYAAEHRAHVMILSDHGHGSLEGKVQPNLMLKRWGHLVLKGVGARSSTRARHLLDRQTKKRRGKFATRNFTLEDDLAVDFSRTRAAVMHAGMAGFLYINLKGRQETGIVDPGDYESLRDQIRDQFLQETCPGPDGRRVRIFPEVHKPEALYGCSRDENPWLPDLLLIPAKALAVVRKIRGLRTVQWLPPSRMEGTHRPEGILAVAGPGVARGRLESNIINITPTVLAMMGLNVPDDLQGEVMERLFDPPLEIGRQAVAPSQSAGADRAVYSEKEQELLTQRLMDLGYLE
ncbi:MAG: alkaline phosphatase family protein [Phycisphaerae bacterium]